MTHTRARQYTVLMYLRDRLLLLIILSVIPFNDGHLMDWSHLTELKMLCEHALICLHDNIMICGNSVSESRTFLDLCDMYEFACETSMVFRHVKDKEQCPDERFLG